MLRFIKTRRFMLTLNLLLCCGFLVFAGCGVARQEGITILVSGNTNGILTPCDCVEGPMAGLAKRATLMNRLDPDGDGLRLDVGGIKNEFPVAIDDRQILKALESMQYDLMVAGKYDETLAISASKEGLHSWQWQLKPDGIVSRFKGIRVVVYPIGPFVSQGKSRVIEGFSSHSIGDLKDRGFKEIPEKTGGIDTTASDHDLVIFCVQMEDSSLQKLLNQHYEVRHWLPDLIVAGPCDQAIPRPDSIMGIPVLKPGVDGMDLLYIQAVRVDQKWKFIPEWIKVDSSVSEDKTVKEILDARE